MVYKPKNSRYCRVKFHWQGRLINKPTRCTSKQEARKVEAKIRTELALGNWGILEPQPKPTLAEFLRTDFLPYVRAKHAAKPRTLDYYQYGVAKLLVADVAKLAINEITNQQAQQFAACHSASLKASTINCSLRVLRHALKEAVEWGKLDRAPKITLLRGERWRDRVLARGEEVAYLGACCQPWRDAAIIILGTGIRPNECFTLRWEANIQFVNGGGCVQVTDGKSKAARRTIPMLPSVLEALHGRWLEQGKPADGWVFPSGAACGHLEQGTAKGQHRRALTDSGVAAFEPYCLRHTALTRLAPHLDAFALARVAGHSSVTMTQRYCHPQADTIERGFTALAGKQPRLPKSPKRVVIDGGNSKKKALPKSTASSS